MGLVSKAFQGDSRLEACLIQDSAHITPGTVGEHVSKVQTALILVDSLLIDARETAAKRYGPSTAAAVLAFKRKRNIVNYSYQTQADDIVGKMTIGALDREMLVKESEQPPARPRSLGIGMSGDDVRNLQGLLNFHLQDMGVARLQTNGVFGPETRAAVLRFQQLAYLPAIGIVDEDTRKALINVGSMIACLALDYRDRDEGTANSPIAELLQTFQRRSSITLPPDALTQLAAGPVGAPPAPGPPVRVVFQGVTVQGGNQLSGWNPWVASPFVVGSQANVLFKIAGFNHPIAFSPGFQFFKNGVGSPSGAWTGQGFIQIGRPSLVPFGPLGQFDLVSPFVQGFLQRNSGQAPQGGFAFGNQATWKLIGDRLGLFLNTQLAFGWGLTDGKGQPVSVQAFTGLQIDLVQLLLRRK